MEVDLEGGTIDLGRMRVAIAFADLSGYTRLTEEEGELTAVDAVERFLDAIEATLPDEARVIKTIGDEAMIVGSDPTHADRLGRRLPEPAHRAAAAADRHPLRGRPVPRRRLLRPRGQHRLAGRGPVGRRRGARHAAGGRGRGRRSPHLEFDAHRRGQAEGVHRAHGDPDRPPAGRGADVRGRARRRACCRPRAPVVVMFSGGRDSTCLLDLAVRIAGADAVTAVHANYGLRGRPTPTSATAPRCARRSGSSSTSAGRCGRRVDAPTGGPAAETSRRGPGPSATGPRPTSPSPAAPTSPPGTRAQIRSRRSSTGSPPRRAGARCSGCAARRRRAPR